MPAIKTDTAKSEYQRLLEVFAEAPAMIAIYRGPEHVIEFANSFYLEVVSKTTGIIGQSIRQAFPELKGQGIYEIHDNVYKTGKAFVGNEVLVHLDRQSSGKSDTCYFNFVYQPLLNTGGKTEGIMVHAVEVTDQVLARKKVEASESKYRNLFNSIDQGLCVIEVIFNKRNKPVDYRFLETNLMFEEQTGLKRAKGKTVLELVPNMEPHWFKTYGNVAITGEPVRFVDCSQALGRWFDIHASRVGRPDSHTVAVLFTDITSSKKAKEDLQKQFQITEAITKNATVCLLMVDTNGIITFMNPAATRVTGYMSSEAVGKPMHSLLHHLRPDGSPFPESECQLVQTFKQGVPFPTREDFMFRKDGSSFPASVTGLSIKGASGIQGTVVEFRDISVEKRSVRRLEESEERLRFMAESMPQKMFTATVEGEVDYFNPQWMEYTGLSFEQIRDWGWLQFIHPDDVKKNVKTWKHSIETGEPFEMEHRFRRHDGKYRWHISRARAMRDESGKIVRWFGSNTDIEDIKNTTKRKDELEEITERLRAQKTELMALNRAKDEFISLASHQLRTPATGVKQYVGMLLAGYAGELTNQQKNFLQSANESNERQLRIIEDLLKVATADSGNMVLNKESVDLVELTGAVIEEQSSSFAASNQTVAFIHNTKKVCAEVDRNSFRMVLENLLDNAHKYTYPGKNIEVRIKKLSKHVDISIKDEGTGIKKSDFKKLFQKFSRLDNTLSLSSGGTGIGLYWVKQIIDLHGATITVDSKLKQGTTFTIRLAV